MNQLVARGKLRLCEQGAAQTISNEAYGNQQDWLPVASNFILDLCIINLKTIHDPAFPVLCLL
jgi:hypothetical protein